ncbi:MAG: TetR/AcrR family transcriptional regulator [Nocardioidaceae bacterium]
MPRPVDTRRREALLDAAVDYVVEHGLAGLSLRPLAAALGTDAPVLLHHFGSKDNLLVLLLNRVRDRLRTVGRSATGDDPSVQLGAVWEWTSDPRHEPLFRLFFEAYGLALQRPGRYAEFLGHVVADWIDELTPAVGADRATLAVAAVRGLLLDLLTTGDRDRVDAAERLLLSFLRPA